MRWARLLQPEGFHRVTRVPPDADASQTVDASRRTWLAAERTWLAWWRTGIATAAVALAVGRLLPVVTHGARWPFRVVGLGYGLLAVAALVIGALRQQATARALRRGSYAELSTPAVIWLTAAAVLLALGSVTLVVVRL
jgi:putative membrane protein